MPRGEKALQFGVFVIAVAIHHQFDEKVSGSACSLREGPLGFASLHSQLYLTLRNVSQLEQNLVAV